MRPAILALGVFSTVVGVFLFVTGYDMADPSIDDGYAGTPERRWWPFEDVSIDFGTIEIATGVIMMAMGVAIAVFGAVSRKKEPRQSTAV